MKNNITVCPICREELVDYKNKLECKNKHCYDKAKEGYTNLLYIKDKKSLNPGDNSIMINARQEFLNKGYYNKLLVYLIEKFRQLGIENLLECGSGEGYYISSIKNELKNIDAYAVDISKIATKKSAKRNKNVSCYVASNYNLPFKNKSLDAILVCFAPFCEKEFARVLKQGGTLVVVRPDKMHLKELRQILFDDEEKSKKSYGYNHFNMEKIDKVKYQFVVDNKQDLQNLFTMTPYYYKTKPDAIMKFNELNKLTITADFEICILKKR